MKGSKKILGVFVFVACALFLVPNNAKAVYIEDVESLKEAFAGKNATVSGKTVTLTGDIIDEDVWEIGGDDYIFDLNGHKFMGGEIYINEASLTINDSTGKGEIDTKFDFLMVADGAKLVLNNGKLDYLANEGNAVINDGKIDIITNYGTMVIEKGVFGPIWQRGDATIKGGTFTSNKDQTSSIDLYTNKTVIEGNVEFKRTEDARAAVILNSPTKIENDAMNKILAEGYLFACSGFGSNSDSWVDEETGETHYIYELSYETTKIIKDITGDIFNKIAPNGVWTINGSKPKDEFEAEFLLSSIVGDIKLPEKYEAYAFAEPADEFDPSLVSIYLDYEGSSLINKTVKAVYNEPSKEIKSKVNTVLDKIAKKIGEDLDVDTGFRLEDLYLINYLNASSKGMDSSLALNFSKDLIALTNGGNISYKFDTRLGSFTPTGLWGFSGGRVIVYHDGVATGTTEIGLTTNHVLYVPSNTADTDDAKIKAALKRIEEYLGTTKGITIKVGGTLESLNNEGFTWKDYGFIDPKTSGTNYYNITINGETYRFAICKKDASKLETPKYLGSDITSNITIKSDSTELPLDTALSVKKVEKAEIKKVLGTDVYAAYDISLYSNAKQENIKKLTNGEFVVSVPIPDALKGKNLTAYYINDKGEKKEHDTTLNDKEGIVSFTTNHFSTYVLAEKVVVENPATFDGVVTSFFIGMMSLIGLIGATFYLKREVK